MTRIQEIAKVDGFGESAKLIRTEIDPLWGLAKGNVSIYRVEATETTIEDIAFDVLASTEEEAEEVAGNHIDATYCGDVEIDDIFKADKGYIPSNFSRLIKK